MSHNKLTDETINERLSSRGIIFLGRTKSNGKNPRGLFQCESCSNNWDAQINSVIGSSKSGCPTCYHKSKIVHGMSDTSAYLSWNDMRQRCDNPNSKNYSIYGMDGITYDKEWNTFEGFWNDMSEGWFEGACICRNGDSGNYEKHNVKWDTRRNNSIESSNKPHMILDTVNEFSILSHSLKEACSILGLKYGSVKAAKYRDRWYMNKRYYIEEIKESE